ncbi:hypothetical protein LTR95_005167 [Oleoguttula sp. CCFEE 5521]
MDQPEEVESATAAYIRQVDTAKAKWEFMGIDHLPMATGLIDCWRVPAESALDSLQPIKISELRPGQRELPNELELRVVSTEYGPGVFMRCTDDDGDGVRLWSRASYPFGRAATSLPAGTLIVVREPYFDKDPYGRPSICVYNPTDLFLEPQWSLVVSDAEQPPSTTPSMLEYMAHGDIAIQRAAPLAATYFEHCRGQYDVERLVDYAQAKLPVDDIADYAAVIETRQSNLSGNGMFANKSLETADLVLVGKPSAITRPVERIGQPRPIDTDRDHPDTRSRSMVLLDKIADKGMSNVFYSIELFALCSGVVEHPQEGDWPVTFDVDRVLRIIKHNAHTTFPGSCSDQHDAFEPSTPIETARKHSFAPDRQCLGLWLKASIFNHSCVPNCHWTWISNIIFIRAVRPIAADEELTVSYIAPNANFAKRNAALASYGFECTCPLCEADKQLTPSQATSREILDQLPIRLPPHPKADVAKTVQRTRLALRAHLRSAYPPGRQLGFSDLPAPSLAASLLALAHMTLGRDVQSWHSASAQVKIRAYHYLHASLSLGLQVHVVYAQSARYCELLLGSHSQARFIGILALIALAELAYLSSHSDEKAMCAPLKHCAKAMYLVCYGEDVTFKSKHQTYACKDVEPEMGEKPGAKEWARCVKDAEEGRADAWEYLTEMK